MVDKQQLPDNIAARRWIMVNYRILDAFGARVQEGSIKLNTGRWALPQPVLLAEVILHLGRDLKEFSESKRSRINITWSFLPVPHPLSTDEPEWLEWLKRQNIEGNATPK